MTTAPDRVSCKSLQTDADVKQSRADKLKAIQHFYLEHLVEEPIDGTDFDCAVLSSIQAIKDRFCPRSTKET